MPFELLRLDHPPERVSLDSSTLVDRDRGPGGKDLDELPVLVREAPIGNALVHSVDDSDPLIAREHRNVERGMHAHSPSSLTIDFRILEDRVDELALPTLK